MNYLTSYKSNKNIIYSCKYSIILCAKFSSVTLDVVKKYIEAQKNV